MHRAQPNSFKENLTAERLKIGHTNCDSVQLSLVGPFLLLLIQPLLRRQPKVEWYISQPQVFDASELGLSIRGFPVELPIGEVPALMRKHSGIRQSSVCQIHDISFHVLMTSIYTRGAMLFF